MALAEGRKVVLEKRNNFYESYTFICKKCGRQVVTQSGILDRRTVFCSSICSRRYWRHSERRTGSHKGEIASDSCD